MIMKYYDILEGLCICSRGSYRGRPTDLTVQAAR